MNGGANNLDSILNSLKGDATFCFVRKLAHRVPLFKKNSRGSTEFPKVTQIELEESDNLVTTCWQTQSKLLSKYDNIREGRKKFKYIQNLGMNWKKAPKNLCMNDDDFDPHLEVGDDG